MKQSPQDSLNNFKFPPNINLFRKNLTAKSSLKEIYFNSKIKEDLEKDLQPNRNKKRKFPSINLGTQNQDQLKELINKSESLLNTEIIMLNINDPLNTKLLDQKIRSSFLGGSKLDNYSSPEKMKSMKNLKCLSTFKNYKSKFNDLYRTNIKKETFNNYKAKIKPKFKSNIPVMTTYYNDENNQKNKEMKFFKDILKKKYGNNHNHKNINYFRNLNTNTEELDKNKSKDLISGKSKFTENKLILNNFPKSNLSKNKTNITVSNNDYIKNNFTKSYFSKDKGDKEDKINSLDKIIKNKNNMFIQNKSYTNKVNIIPNNNIKFKNYYSIESQKPQTTINTINTMASNNNINYKINNDNNTLYKTLYSNISNDNTFYSNETLSNNNVVNSNNNKNNKNNINNINNNNNKYKSNKILDSLIRDKNVKGSKSNKKKDAFTSKNYIKDEINDDDDGDESSSFRLLMKAYKHSKKRLRHRKILFKRKTLNPYELELKIPLLLNNFNNLNASENNNKTNKNYEINDNNLNNDINIIRNLNLNNVKFRCKANSVAFLEQNHLNKLKQIVNENLNDSSFSKKDNKNSSSYHNFDPIDILQRLKVLKLNSRELIRKEKKRKIEDLEEIESNLNSIFGKSDLELEVENELLPEEKKENKKYAIFEHKAKNNNNNNNNNVINNIHKIKNNLKDKKKHKKNKNKSNNYNSVNNMSDNEFDDNPLDFDELYNNYYLKINSFKKQRKIRIKKEKEDRKFINELMVKTQNKFSYLLNK